MRRAARISRREYMWLYLSSLLDKQSNICKFEFYKNTNMRTASYKKIYNLPFTFEDALKLIKSFSIEDKLRLEKELEKRNTGIPGTKTVRKN